VGRGERSEVSDEQLEEAQRVEEAQQVARREAAPFVLLAVVADGLLAFVSAWHHWQLYSPDDWWIWVGLALPAALLAVVFSLGFGRLGVSREHRRKAAVILLALLVLGNLLAVALVLGSLVSGGAQMTGLQLLATAAVVIFVNVITFALVFWEVDCDGPVARAMADRRVTPDFQFPQDENPGLAAKDWVPALQDYLYIAMTNSIAFSPTDAMPLTHRAKLFMGIESLIASVTLLIVAARAVNILQG
jgi:hypothetical protein